MSAKAEAETLVDAMHPIAYKHGCTCVVCGPARDEAIALAGAALTAYAEARVAAAVETCAAIVEAFDDDANDGRLREAAARIRAHRAPGAGAVVCKARTANHGAGDPPECDWPFCGCDPMADQVLAAIDESGYRLVRDGAPAADTGQEA